VLRCMIIFTGSLLMLAVWMQLFAILCMKMCILGVDAEGQFLVCIERGVIL
jgi:hypothetical protein